MEKKTTYKVIVVSDSHGNDARLRYAIGQELPFDLLIHCGDAEADLKKVLGDHTEYEIAAVQGNMDWTMPLHLELKLGYTNILVVHGDRYGVKRDYEGVADLGRQLMADVVCFGHTHVPAIEKTQDNILLLNPGSVAKPHQDPPKCTYAVLTIDEDLGPSAVIRELPDYIPGERSF